MLVFVYIAERRGYQPQRDCGNQKAEALLEKSVTTVTAGCSSNIPQYSETEILITINTNRQLVIDPSRIVVADSASHGGDQSQKSWWWASLKISHLPRTHNREPGSIALASLSAVLVLCDAAVGGQSVFLLHLWDVQGSKWGQEETITCGEQKSWREGRKIRQSALWITNAILIVMLYFKFYIIFITLHRQVNPMLADFFQYCKSMI